MRRHHTARTARTLPLLAAVLLTGCVTTARPDQPRPARPMPAAVASRYAVETPVRAELDVDVGGSPNCRYRRLRLRSGEEVVHLRLVEPVAPPPPGGRPLVLCLPILAGGDELLWIFADYLCHRGYTCAWTARVGSTLKPGQDVAELEEVFRRTVVHNRIALAWARRAPGLDPERSAVLGASLGGMVGAALLATEPDLAGGVLAMAGGDLPDLLLRSSERRAVRWRRWRRGAQAVPDSEIRREARRALRSDPLHLGPYVATERVLLIKTALDDVIPPANQDALWRALGRPTRVTVPLGHLSAALSLPMVLSRADAFFRARFAAGGADRRAAAAGPLRE